jgi:biotin operon repressor
MAFNDTFERLERLAYLIQRKATGSPEELAEKLGVSVRTVANLLDQLRNWGAEIAYCRDRGSYYYVYPVELCFTVVKSSIDYAKVKGGEKKSYDVFVNAAIIPWIHTNH